MENRNIIGREKEMSELQRCLDSDRSELVIVYGRRRVATEVSAWFDQADKKKAVRGSQIDLIIERADRIIHLCEMKFSQSEYRITADYEEKLRNRMALFKEKTKNKQTVVHTFVTIFGVANGKHSSLVHSEVTLDGLFIA